MTHVLKRNGARAEGETKLKIENHDCSRADDQPPKLRSGVFNSSQ